MDRSPALLNGSSVRFGVGFFHPWRVQLRKESLSPVVILRDGSSLTFRHIQCQRLWLLYAGPMHKPNIHYQVLTISSRTKGYTGLTVAAAKAPSDAVLLQQPLRQMGLVTQHIAAPGTGSICKVWIRCSKTAVEPHTHTHTQCLSRRGCKRTLPWSDRI